MGRGSSSHCRRECAVCHKGVTGRAVGRGPSSQIKQKEQERDIQNVLKEWQVV